MPATGVDLDGDSIYDTVQPGSIGYDGKPNYVSGTSLQLVDFYWSDASGAAYKVIGSQPNPSYQWSDGSQLWRGKGNVGDPLQSGGPGIDTAWSTLGDRARFNLISDIIYSYDDSARVLTYRIIANVKNTADSQAVAAELPENQTTVTLVRSVRLRYQS